MLKSGSRIYWVFEPPPGGTHPNPGTRPSNPTVPNTSVSDPARPFPTRFSGFFHSTTQWPPSSQLTYPFLRPRTSSHQENTMDNTTGTSECHLIELRFGFDLWRSAKAVTKSRSRLRAENVGLITFAQSHCKGLNSFEVVDNE